jgi:hypothetical protein
MTVIMTMTMTIIKIIIIYMNVMTQQSRPMTETVQDKKFNNCSLTKHVERRH